MKTTITATAIALFLTTGCETVPTHRMYVANDFELRAERHSSVAVLPFDVSERDATGVEKVETEADAEDGEVDAEASAEAEAAEAKAAEERRKAGLRHQGMLYQALLAHSEKLGYTVRIQDIDKTNGMLDRMTSETTPTKESLASALGVDALLSGTVSGIKLLTEGQAFRKDLVANVLAALATGEDPHLYGRTRHSATDDIAIAVTLHDAGGELLWSFDDRMSTSSMSQERMADKILANVAKAFPYVPPAPSPEE